MGVFYDLIPDTIGDFDNWTLDAGPDKPTAVQTNDGNTSYLRIGTSPGAGNTKQSFVLGTRPQIVAVIAVTYNIDVMQETGIAGAESIFLTARLGGVEGTAVAVSPGSGAGYINYTGVIPRPGGGVWTVPDIEDPTLQIVLNVPDDNGAAARWTHGKFIVEGVPANPGSGREIGTAALRILRRNIRYSRFEVGPEMLDNELMDDISLSHYAHPLTPILGEVDENGVLRTGLAGWQRVLTQFREEEINLNTLTVSIMLRDRRWDLLTFYDSGRTLRTLANIEDGVALLMRGLTREYTRPSVMWLEDPGSDLVVELDLDQRPTGRDGFRPESFASQILLRTSFVSGVAGLTHTGAGTGVAESPAESPLFDEEVSDNCLLLTAGNPHGSDGVETWPTSNTMPATGNLRFSIDHKDDAGAVLDWQIERTSDNQFFDDSDGTYNVGSTWNALPVRETRTRDRSTFKVPLATGDSVILRLRQASGGTVSRENRVYHVQLENNGIGHVTSRIVSDTTAVARELQLYELDMLCFQVEQGRFHCRFTPDWDAADMNVTGNFPTFFQVWFNVADDITKKEDGYLLYYNGGLGNTLTFEVRIAGVQHTVDIPWTPVRGTTYIVACRWVTMDRSEFEHPAGAISVFVGIDGSIAAAHDVRPANPDTTPGEAPLPAMYVGTSDEDAAANGSMADVLFSQQPWSDDEMQSGRW